MCVPPIRSEFDRDCQFGRCSGWIIAFEQSAAERNVRGEIDRTHLSRFLAEAPGRVLHEKCTNRKWISVPSG